VATRSDTIADRTLFFFCSRTIFLLDRLAKILAKKNLSEKKLDELKIKANILAAFTEKEEKKDETIAREKAEL
jgi:lauroyl/myristoyl acyltransferase